MGGRHRIWNRGIGVDESAEDLPEINRVKAIPSSLPMRLGAGLVAGAVIVYVDNFAFEGEVSPIIIVAMLLAATATAAAIWGGGGWVPAGVAWAGVPLAHLVKHALGLPDTLHPNTYTSILYLAAFTLFVATVGAGFGLLARWLAVRAKGRDSGPA
jgi:hypothetical protein